MTPVIRHLPLTPHREFDPENMTPAEITAWLNARDRQLWLQRLNYIVNFALGFVAVLLAVTLYQFLTR
jgi:hypothetical protein